jgi:hypothetical protein
LLGGEYGQLVSDKRGNRMNGFPNKLKIILKMNKNHKNIF